MKREDNKIMEALSTSLYGKKYQWKKLMTQGVMTVEQDNGRHYLRRHPLTAVQAKDFMLKKLKAQVEKQNPPKEETDV